MDLLEDVPIRKLSPFLIERLLTSRAELSSVKKLRSGNLLVEVMQRRQAENLLRVD